jgi:sugar-specific transcriptional regulator TrmB
VGLEPIIVSLAGVLLSFLVVVRALWPFRLVSNENFENALIEAPEFIDRAKHELKILSGTLYPDFYNAEPILKAFERAIARGVEIKILCGPEADLGKVPKLKEWIDERKIEVRRLLEDYSPHFMVADGGQHIRLEERHPRGSPKGTKAIIVYNSVELGPKYNLIFNRLWNSLEK